MKNVGDEMIHPGSTSKVDVTKIKKKRYQQECIPVGCVPLALYRTGGLFGGGFSIHGVSVSETPSPSSPMKILPWTKLRLRAEMTTMRMDQYCLHLKKRERIFTFLLSGDSFLGLIICGFVQFACLSLFSWLSTLLFSTSSSSRSSSSSLSVLLWPSCSSSGF